MPPFTVQDLVRLARISEPAVSPDGKRVAYALRTTDMDANKGRTGIWLLDIRKRNAAAVRLTDLAANSSAPEWSGDGRFLYYLSNRSGSSQVWRLSPGKRRRTHPGHESAARCRLLPGVAEGRSRLGEHGGVPRLRDARLHQAAAGCGRARQQHGVLYDRIFVRHWDTWSDGRRSQLFSLALEPSGTASGTPVNLTEGLDGDVPEKPFGGREDYAVSPDGQKVAFSMRAVPVGEPWSTNFDIYSVPAAGGTPRNLTADNPAWDGQPAFSPTARPSPTLPWTGRDTSPIAFIWCSSICRTA